MTSYVLSIVGIAFLGVLVDVIMPDGEMNKYVKGVFAIIAMCVIISPLPKLFGGEIDLTSSLYDSKASSVDVDFLIATQKQMEKELEISLKNRLKDEGFYEIEVDILTEMSNYNFQIKKVVIDIKNMVMSEENQHINKYVKIKEIAQNYLKLEESDVVINE